ncbi:MAG: hypothetical protein CMH48_15755 [Muricauda sp.]|nr:porin family protein [Allomuricauda sp.]MBC32281.1 hypothetical protein [Allomuricauda sp.]|tara:strand:+ start:56997 stop:57686 length:690 start_codon:yes stop_codon:yes gene_type:complete
MKRCLLLVFATIFGLVARAQVYPESEYAGTKYLEDQFYVGVGYNFLVEKPKDVVQRGLSYSLQAGFIRDIPLNKRRNVGFGLGAGYSVSSYYTNMVAAKEGDDISYSIADLQDFKRSKLETHALEVPLEFRWRTSTDVTYKFWRVYGGVKVSYIFAKSYRRVNESGSDRFRNDDLQDLQYGAFLRFGYNTWNINIYYGLNSLLKDDVFLGNDTPIELRPLKVGLIFYIL